MCARVSLFQEGNDYRDAVFNGTVNIIELEEGFDTQTYANSLVLCFMISERVIPNSLALPFSLSLSLCSFHLLSHSQVLHVRVHGVRSSVAHVHHPLRLHHS